MGSDQWRNACPATPALCPLLLFTLPRPAHRRTFSSRLTGLHSAAAAERASMTQADTSSMYLTSTCVDGVGVGEERHVWEAGVQGQRLLETLDQHRVNVEEEYVQGGWVGCPPTSSHPCRIQTHLLGTALTLPPHHPTHTTPPQARTAQCASSASLLPSAPVSTCRLRASSCWCRVRAASSATRGATVAVYRSSKRS